MPQNKKRVNSQDSIRRKKARKKGFTYWDEYSDLYTLKRTPVSMEMIDRIIIDLIAWASSDPENKRKKALLLRDFFQEKGIPTTTYERWLTKHKTFKEAYQQAKLMIASNREKGGLFRDYEKDLIKLRQHAYDPEWKKDEEWRAELREKKQQQESNFSFNINTIPNSNLVPDRPVKTVTVKEESNNEDDTDK